LAGLLPRGTIPLLFRCSAELFPCSVDIIPLFDGVAEFVRKRLSYLLFLDEKSGFFTPDIGVFPVNSAAAGEFGFKPRA
jgi:hypothetical protein